MNKKIWLSLAHMGGKEQEYIKEAFDTNWVVPLGPNVDTFEISLENFLRENKKVVALSAGTAALHLALVMLGVKAGDEVICQSFTFAASANPVCYLGATPIFVDSEKDTWNMCPIQLELAIKDRISKGKKPKAIIPVHLYGMPSKMHEITKIAECYNIPIIEDAAEALGSRYNGQECGTFGQLGVLSFNGNKIITTSGGGALVCNSTEEAQLCKFYATQARDNAPHYQHSKIGYNYRMSNICAGIGRGQMLVLEEHIKRRQEIHNLYVEGLKTVEGISFQQNPSSLFESNYWLTSILLDPLKIKKNREELRIALDKENIETRPLWKPMHLQPIFNDVPYYGTNVCETLFDQGICLPSGSILNNADITRVITAIKTILQ